MMIGSFENVRTLAELFSLLDNIKGEDEEMVNIAFNSNKENRTRMAKGVRARQDSIFCGIDYNDNLIVCLGSYYAEHPEIKEQFNPDVPIMAYPVTIEFNTKTLEIQVYNNVKSYETAFIHMEKMFKEYNVAALVEQIAESFGCDLHICTAERCEGPADDEEEDNICGMSGKPCEDDCMNCGSNCEQCGTSEKQKGAKGMEALFGKASISDEDDIDDEDTDNYDECEGCCGCNDCRECYSADSDEDDCCEDNTDFDDYTLGELKELAVYGEQYLAEQEAGAEAVEACDITEYDRAIKIIKEASEKLFNIELADREAELIYTVLFNSKQISDNLYK